MNIFSRWFGSKDVKSDPPSMPWDQHPSIFEFVQSHPPEEKWGMIDAAYELPDAERIENGSKLKWAAGTMDGVATHHCNKSDSESSVRKMVALVNTYSRQPTAKNKLAVYNHIITEHIISIIDDVIEALAKKKGINQERLYELARSFAKDSPDREPVKFGLALLGLFRKPADQEIYQILGGHEEFTLYSAVAISNSLESPDEDL